VIQELAEKGHAGGMRRVIAVIRAQFRVGDQPDRTFVQRIPGVEEAARRAEFTQRLLH